MYSKIDLQENVIPGQILTSAVASGAGSHREAPPTVKSQDHPGLNVQGLGVRRKLRREPEFVAHAHPAETQSQAEIAPARGHEDSFTFHKPAYEDSPLAGRRRSLVAAGRGARASLETFSQCASIDVAKLKLDRRLNQHIKNAAEHSCETDK